MAPAAAAALRRLGLLLLLPPLLLLLLPPPPPPGLLGAAGDDLPLPPGGQPVPPQEAGGGGGGRRRLLSSSSAAPASPPPEGLAAWLWLASSSSWSSLPLLPPEAQLGPECRHLLLAFAESSVRLTGCLARSARPVTVCQNCHGPFREVQELLENITRPAANTTAGNHCAKSLLMSDRLQIVVILSNFFNDTWKEANCANCLNVNGEGLSNSTVTFLALFNQSMTCFEHNLQRPEDNLLSDNQSDVCKNCNETYRKLNDMYNNMQKSVQQEESGEEFHLCIDIEDAMNITRRLWSTTFNCSVPCSDTVPVVAVSSFILFLPVVFYLSSFLHSKQKKRILMPSKRFQSHDSSVNIQENMN